MNVLENIVSQEIIQKLGWVLVHFVWQGVLVALVLAISLRVLRKSSANLRYVAACVSLGLIVLLPVITFRMIDVSTVKPIITKSVSVEAATDEVSMAEIAVTEPAVSVEGVALTQGIAWRERIVSVLESALPYIVFGWLVGVFGLSLWHLGGWTQLQRLRRRMVKSVSESLRSKLKELAELLGVNQAVEIVESALVGVPTVVGWLKPVILLPASALTGLSSEQIEAILAHELAHIKRCDYLVNMLQTVVEILGFYHPAVWWVSRKVRVERENCCDDLAVSISGDKVHYARALTSMAEIRAGQPRLAVAASGGSLFGRISRLVGRDNANKEKAGWLPSVIAILLIMALVIPTALALSAKTSQKIDLDKRIDYSSVTIEEGVGFDDIIVGDVNCTGEFIKSKLGKPDKDTKNTQTKGRWLDYKEKFGVDFWLDKNNVLKEIRFNKGFKGKLQSGISMVSTVKDVFDVYGEPVAEKKVGNLTKYFDNQVLYRTTIREGFRKVKYSKIFYTQNGLLFWFKKDNINQIVIHPKESKPDVQVEGENRGRMTDDRSQKSEITGTKEWMQNLVEDFFEHNYRDITARKTIEWGKPTVDENGNLFIRYKYEATIWDKDKIIDNKIFSFDKDGKFVSVTNVDGFPIKKIYLVTFKPARGFNPTTARELLDAFNENHPPEAVTHHFRTKKVGSKLYGIILVDGKKGTDAVVQMLAENENLTLVRVKPAKEKDLEKHNDLEQVDLEKPQAKEEFIYELQDNLYAQLPPEVIQFIGNTYGSISMDIKGENLYSNSHIYYVTSDFALMNGGLGYYQNLSYQPLFNKIRLSGTTKPYQTHFDNAGRKMDTEIVPDKVRPGFYHIYWRPYEPLAPKQFFYYGWSIDGSRKLQSADEKYSLRMNNKFGNSVVETFFLVLPQNLGIITQSENYTAKETVSGFDIYYWQKEVPANTNHTVDVELTEVTSPIVQTVIKEKIEQAVKNAVMTISTCAESDPRVAKSLESLKGLDEQAAVKEVAKFLDSDKNTVRRSAIYILWKGNFKSIEPAAFALERLCSHEEEYTRGMAALALGAGKVGLSFDTLCKMTLEDSSAYARRCAAYALGQLGMTKAKPVLEKALKDNDFNVRNNAEAALTMISQAKKQSESDMQVEVENRGRMTDDRRQKTELQVIEDKELNLSVGIPADWSCYKNPVPGRYKFSWQLLPSKLKAWAMFIGSEGFSQADIPVRQIAVGDVAILKGYFNEYTVRADSWAQYSVSKMPAVSYVADYVDEGTAMVEYRSYILGQSMVYWFVFRIEKDKFDSNKEQFASIVNSFKVKRNEEIKNSDDLDKTPATGAGAKQVLPVAVSENLEIADVNFEPIRQGKNVVWITVENKSDKSEFFGVNVYSRSVDYGPQGVGWGRSLYEKFNAGQTKKLRYVYKVQGPVTENTYIRLSFYNAKSLKHSENKDLKPFAVRVYKSSDLKRESEEKPESISSKDFTEIIIGNFIKVQRFIKDKKYEEAWKLFSEDYQRAEYQVGGLERFEKAMEPKHPLDSAFTWEKSQFLKLEPKHLDINARNNSVTLSATYKKEAWKISFAKEGDQWKIDDIVGYRPAILDMQEADSR